MIETWDNVNEQVKADWKADTKREMAELTEILHTATDESLVLLDEVGRGTATTDGLAIARATTEFLHDEVEATTLFATHYHELTTLEAAYEGVFTLHFTADRDDDGVTFLHRVADGPSSSSYGIEVARLAGVPEDVVERAQALVAAADTAEDGDDSETRGEDSDITGGDSSARADSAATRPDVTADAAAATNGKQAGQSVESTGENALSASAEITGGHAKSAPRPTSSRASRDEPNHVVREILADIAAVDVAETTPMEALSLLHELQRRLDETNQET